MSWGGLGKPQRRWVLERDKYRCQHFTYHKSIGKWIQCPERNPKKLHVHHIFPKRFMTIHLHWIDPHRPFNLLTLCVHHHNGEKGVHPDMSDALKEYRKGNKDSFVEKFKARRVLVDDGRIYWNTEHDWQYIRRARKLTLNYSRKVKYPEKRRKPGWVRPKK